MTQKGTSRQTEQSRKPRKRPSHIWNLINDSNILHSGKVCATQKLVVGQFVIHLKKILQS